MASLKPFYIVPALELKDTLQNEVDNSPFRQRKEDNSVKEFSELYKRDFVVIISEPGNGKSRLLKEVVLRAEEFKLNAIYINLKSIGLISIKQKINELLKRVPQYLETNEVINEISDYFFTKKFKFDANASNTIVCLDALDEVSSDLLFDYFDKIENFRVAFPHCKVILSCREYLYRRYETHLKAQKPQLIEIQPFNYYRIKQYLIHYGFSDSDVEKVINQFWNSFELSIINSPRVLEIFKDIKKNEGLDKVLNKTKAELLDHFIYGKLKFESKKKNIDKADIIKRVLEKLALTMVMYQRTELTRDELLTFFDDVKSNLTASFLNQVNIHDFQNRSLLIFSKDDSLISFHNSEFQEYLAAKEIIRLGRTEQVLFDLSIDKTLNEFYPFWTNTIKFVLTLLPSTQLPLLRFICRKESTFNNSLLNDVLVSDSISVNRLSDEEKSISFDLLYDLHQSIKWHFSNGIARKISKYYLPEKQHKILEHMAVVKSPIIIENALHIFNCLYEKDKLVMDDHWKSILLELYYNPDSTKRIKSSCIEALSHYKEIDLIANLKNSVSEFFNDIFRAARKIDPNNKFTIELLVESFKNENKYSYSERGIQEIKSKDGIKLFLEKIVQDEQLRNSLELRTMTQNELQKFVENTEGVYCEEIESVLHQMVLESYDTIYQNKFLDLIIRLLAKKNPFYINHLLEDIKTKDANRRDWFRYNDIFNKILTVNNVETFLKAAVKIEGARQFLPLLFLIDFANSKDEERKKIFEISETYLSDEFKKQRDIWKANSREIRNAPDIYQQFKRKLSPSPDKFDGNVFDFYHNNKEYIQKRLKLVEKKKMKELLENVLLKWDFGNGKSLANYKDKEKRSYSISDSLLIFGDAIDLFEEFGIDKNVYRPKLVRFIPYSFENNNREKLFKRIGALSSDEIDYLFKFYSTPREDDLITINIDQLLNVTRHYKIEQLAPLIRNIIFSSVYDTHIKSSALDVLYSVEFDPEVYNKVFMGNIDSIDSTERNMAERANAFLIENKNSYQENAVAWRISALATNKVEYTDPDDPEGYNSYEIRHKARSFNAPLLMLDEPKFQLSFFTLLKEGVNNYTSNELRSYAVYLIDTVQKYFDNQKICRNYGPIQALEKEIQNYSEEACYSLLKYMLGILKISYADSIGRSVTYTECIRTYNDLKEKVYAIISSSLDLYNMLQDILDNDIRKWVEQEGGYKVVGKEELNETIIQKTIQSQIENGFLRRGMRDKEIRIFRESQFLDDKRTDFTVSYGFIGQILIELKLTKNPDATSKDYPMQLLQYIKGSKSDFGVFLLFQTTTDCPWKKIETKVRSLYEPYSNDIRVIGMDCTKNKF